MGNVCDACIFKLGASTKQKKCTKMKRQKKKKSIKLLKNKKRAARRSRRIKRKLLTNQGRRKTRKLAKPISSIPTISYKFVQKGGKQISGTEIVFPIIRRKDDGHFEFVATGFFINSWGGFATAKHIFFGKEEELTNFYGVHVHENNTSV